MELKEILSIGHDYSWLYLLKTMTLWRICVLMELQSLHS